jgi:hypothetical protein
MHRIAYGSMDQQNKWKMAIPVQFQYYGIPMHILPNLEHPDQDIAEFCNQFLFWLNFLSAESIKKHKSLLSGFFQTFIKLTKSCNNQILTEKFQKYLQLL